MRISFYDDGYKKSVRSPLFFSHKNVISLYLGGNSTPIYKGDYEGLKELYTRPKHVMCLFLLTKDGLVEVQTNISIAIDLLKKVQSQTLDYQIVLTPTVYDKDAPVSKPTMELLGPLAFKNPPTYAMITLGDPATDEVLKTLQAGKYAKLFNAYKEFRNGQTPEIIDQVKEVEIIDGPTIATAPKESARERVLRQERDKNLIEEPDLSDDLPF